jgi:phosphate transport system substrate-binding protein
LLGVDNGEGCVKPSPETIASGTYNPLSRPLLIYVNVESLQKPQVLEFVKFYMEMGAELTAEVGYVPEDDSVFQSNLQAVLDAAS